MRILKIFTLAGLTFILLLLVSSCSKDRDNSILNDELKSGAMNNSYSTGETFQVNKFATGRIMNMINKYIMGHEFANKPFGNSFAGGTPGNADDDQPGQGTGSLTIGGDNYPLNFGAYEGFEDGWFDLYLLDFVPYDPDDIAEGSNGDIF
jgi:hypothetical protein